MSSFKGTYRFSVDSKGRVNIPSKLRKSLSDEIKDYFVVTRGFDKCVYVFPLDEWAKTEEELQKLSDYDSDDRLFSRLMYENATDVQLDSQARIVIPVELRQHANIEGDILIIGNRNKIELWNPKVYEDYKTKQTESYESVAGKVMNPGGTRDNSA
jgi:MraZ protein